MNCRHIGHASNFTFPITIVKGDELWSGEYGEKLVRSKETGRLFFTKCEGRGPWRPVMVTYEIIGGELPRVVVRNLEFNYGSMQHSKVANLMDILKRSGGVTKWPKSFCGTTPTHTRGLW
jgi:hypothetical protein